MSIIIVIAPLMWLRPDIFASALMKWMYILFMAIASFSCGLSMGKFMKKYPPLNDILWSVFAGSIYVIIYRYLFSYWVGRIVVIFGGMVIVYYFLLGVVEMMSSLQKEKTGIKETFSFVVELTAFIASICAILDALLEVI